MKYVEFNIVNHLYLIFSKVNGYFEEVNKNKYLIIVSTNESKERITRYEEVWSKIRDLTRSETKNSDDFDEKYMKIKFSLHGELPLNKTIEIPGMTIIVRAVFLEKSKYYTQFLLDECLYKNGT